MSPRDALAGLPERVPVAVVGAGQAGLSMSRLLTGAGVEHVVLDRHGVAHEWRTARWDSFCLVTPNWQCDLPGYPYAGGDPDGFMVKDEIVAYAEGYAASFGPPVHAGAEVTGLTARPGGGFALRVGTAGGDGRTLLATEVVVATGGYHRPVVPGWAGALPPGVVQLHSSSYRNPGALPEGAVLVVGTGQSGAQIAEDLHLAGRCVHLATGAAPRCSRRYRGRDVVAWLHDMGHYDRPIGSFADPGAVRARTNHYVTGRDGGRDIDLRAFAAQGMRLHGRAVGLDGGVLRFAGDLRANLDGADAVLNGINASIDAWIDARGLRAGPPAVYRPVWEPGEEVLELDVEAAGITSVIWCIGFRPDWSWLHVPVLDAAGRPVHARGVTPVPGLSFLGLPWLHTWGSGRFGGVGRDAAHLTSVVTDRLAGGLLPATG